MWGSGGPGGAAVTVAVCGSRDCFLHLPAALAARLRLQQVRVGSIRGLRGRTSAGIVGYAQSAPAAMVTAALPHLVTSLPAGLPRVWGTGTSPAAGSGPAASAQPPGAGGRGRGDEDYYSCTILSSLVGCEMGNSPSAQHVRSVLNCRTRELLVPR